MGLLELFITASIPVLKTLLITALGSYLALESVDILGEDARKHLNTIGAIYLWSYVYNIVRLSSRRITIESGGKDISRESSTSDLGSCTEPLLSSTKEYSICEVPKEYSITEDHEEQHSVPCARTVTKSEIAIADKIKQTLAQLFKKINLKAIFAPSTTGAIVGFTIGLIPEIRKLLIGEVAPLRVIQDSASLLGDGAIPALTLIVGGNLLRGLHGSGISKSLIFGIVAVRYIALPLTGVLVIRGAHQIGLVHSDPLYQFILLLQYAVPPAMNIGVITQLFGTGESECSVIMLWTYSLASVSLTVWSTFFMWLVS